MPVTNYSTTPSSNILISGINIAEGCPAGNMNGAIRQMMADIRAMYDALPDVSNLVAATGGVFTGNPIYNGRGGYVYHDNASNTSGRIFIQAIGNPAPSGMSNGDLLLEF